MRNGACPHILLAVRTALAPLRSLLGGPGGRSEALEGRVGFEPTTPGSRVRVSSAEPALRREEGPTPVPADARARCYWLDRISYTLLTTPWVA